MQASRCFAAHSGEREGTLASPPVTVDSVDAAVYYARSCYLLVMGKHCSASIDNVWIALPCMPRDFTRFITLAIIQKPMLCMHGKYIQLNSYPEQGGQTAKRCRIFY